MENDAIAVTVLVADVLEMLNVPYFIGGSLASTFYGLVRTTQDSDIISKLQLEQVSAFVAALEKDFFVDQEMIVEAITRRSSFNIIHRETMFKVDVFIPRFRPFEKSQFERSQKEQLSADPGLIARLASAEDTVLAKLEWYRMGGEVSDRQWRDIVGVLKVQGPELDYTYMHRMAGDLELDDLLSKAIAEK